MWRVFPWDEAARPGEPFSPDYFPQQSGLGRFDLPRSTGASAWYFAESAEHAIAEKIQDLRNRVLFEEFLFERGRRLAICSIALAPEVRIADLCDPAELLDRSIRPDHLAYKDRATTQAIAHGLHRDPELNGFRWWSALFGEWHTVVLFSDRVDEGGLSFGAAEHLTSISPELVRAAAVLGIEIREPS